MEEAAEKRGAVFIMVLLKYEVSPQCLPHLHVLGHKCGASIPHGVRDVTQAEARRAQEQTGHYWVRNLYLQLFAEALRVGNILVVLVSLVKPSATSHFRHLFLPVHGIAQPLLQMHVIPSPFRWNNQLFNVFLCEMQGLR